MSNNVIMYSFDICELPLYKRINIDLKAVAYTQGTNSAL